MCGWGSVVCTEMERGGVQTEMEGSHKWGNGHLV